MTKKSLRVYFIAHHDGRFTGILLRTWAFLFDRPAPAEINEATFWMSPN